MNRIRIVAAWYLVLAGCSTQTAGTSQVSEPPLASTAPSTAEVEEALPQLNPAVEPTAAPVAADAAAPTAEPEAIPVAAAAAGDAASTLAPAARAGVKPRTAKPKLVPCRTTKYTVSLVVDDVAALGFVGHSSATESATLIEHYRSAVEDLNRKTIDELNRRHGAGLLRCSPTECTEDEHCGLRVVAIRPDAPDGYTDGTPVPEQPGLPRRWMPSTDFRSCRFRDVTAPDSPLRHLMLTVDCTGCSRRK